MKRTDAEAHDNNQYTEGNPSLGVPATVVGAEEMNNLQNELAEIVEAADITLDGLVFTQVLQAIRILMQRGGTEYKIDILNNQASAQDLTGLLFDATDDQKALVIPFDLQRDTDSSNLVETGHIFLSYNNKTSSWNAPQVASHFDDAGVVFSITAGGQLQYTSSNIAGTNYNGKLRVAGITQMRQGA